MASESKIEFGPIDISNKTTTATWRFNWEFQYVKTGLIKYGCIEIPNMTFDNAYETFKEEHWKYLFDPIKGYIKKLTIDKV